MTPREHTYEPDAVDRVIGHVFESSELSALCNHKDIRQIRTVVRVVFEVDKYLATVTKEGPIPGEEVDYVSDTILSGIDSMLAVRQLLRYVAEDGCNAQRWPKCGSFGLFRVCWKTVLARMTEQTTTPVEVLRAAFSACALSLVLVGCIQARVEG